MTIPNEPRDAVARTINEAIMAEGPAWSDTEIADAILSEHIAPLAAEIERLRAAHSEERARAAGMREALHDIAGKCELARSVYATEETANPSRAAEAFTLIRDVARRTLTPEQPHDE